MTDLETRDILHEALELLKTQMVYVRNLNDAFASLHSAVMRVDPRLTLFDKEEILKIRPNAVQDHALTQIDALLQQLEGFQ